MYVSFLMRYTLKGIQDKVRFDLIRVERLHTRVQPVQQTPNGGILAQGTVKRR
jgi:hypothetical protein